MKSPTSFLRERWQRLRNWWPPRLRQRVTRAGIAYSAAMLLVAAAAFVSANNLLFLILAAMLSTLLVSGFVSRMGLAGLELDLVLPRHTSARRRVHARARLKNAKRWIPSFSIRLEGAAESGFESILYFPVIPGGASVEESAGVMFPRRGAHRERSFQLSTRFPFGFVERRERITIRHEVIVYPCLDPQPGFDTLLASVSGEMEAMQRGRGNDFYRIRPYEPLESARHVDWKATAHTGDLQVREFARDEDRRVEIYLDLDVPSRAADWFERAIECVAYLAYELAARGSKVRLRTQNADIATPEAGNIYTILKYLALVTPVRGKALADASDSYELHCFQIVFSTNRARTSAQGWGSSKGVGAVVLGLDDLPGAAGARPTESAGGSRKA